MASEPVSRASRRRVSTGIRRAVVGCVLVVVFPVAASAGQAGSATISGTGSALVWQDCGDGFQCATLTVPLDYRKPTGTQIDVALIRRPAEDPSARIGSLLTNPGGPGVSGIRDLRMTAAGYPPEVRARFDLVSFDPRGVGASTTVNCLDPPDLQALGTLDASPDTPEKRDALLAGFKHLAQGCQQRSAGLLRFVSAQDAARDMDRIRAALGDPKLTYVGYSYGTYLGALYAQFFPKRVRALVLDGAVEPHLGNETLVLGQATAYEQALEAFFAGCAASPDCRAARGGNPGGAYDDLMARIERDGIPAPGFGDRRLGPSEAQTAIPALLTGGEPIWPLLATALTRAAAGDGTTLVSVADAVARAANVQANAAIACSDLPLVPRHGIAGIPPLVERARQTAPHFQYLVNAIASECAAWPVHPVPAPSLHAQGAPAILVIGTRNDPATPFPWAQELARRLKPGVLLSAPGYSHTSFATARAASDRIPIPAKTCVDDIAVRYLVDLQAPPNPTRCE